MEFLYKETRRWKENRLINAMSADLAGQETPYELFYLESLFPDPEEEHTLIAYKESADPNNMYMHKAMKEPDAGEFKKAMRGCQMLWMTWLCASFVICVGLTSLSFSNYESCSLLPLGLNSLLTCGVFHSVENRVHLEVELGDTLPVLMLRTRTTFHECFWDCPR